MDSNTSVLDLNPLSYTPTDYTGITNAALGILDDGAFSLTFIYPGPVIPFLSASEFIIQADCPEFPVVEITSGGGGGGYA